MPEYMPTIKVKDVIGLVEQSQWILPTFQRKYVWEQEQICDLFDSIMRSYPISTFMIWKVNKETATNHTFYQFIQDYQEWWRETGESFSPKASEYYYAVIDGQQRINSLYIGYHGSYAAKLKNKRWRKAYDESIQPKTYLYLNLFENADENTSRLYDFRFFSETALREEGNGEKWFKVGDILSFKYMENDDVDEELPKIVEAKRLLQNCTEGERAIGLKKLKMLYKKTFHSPIINYYQEENQDLERVVDIFLRSNGGGTPLEFSDLVMSVMTSRWAEAKDKIENLTKVIYAETGIRLNKDFVLKVFLVLYSNDIGFKVKNFECDNSVLINRAKDNFEIVSQTIQRVCKYITDIGLNDVTLRSKYALIPIIYFCSKNDVKIDNVVKEKRNRRLIEIWLKAALLKGMFGGKPDAVLASLRKILDANNGEFPTRAIVEAFKNKSKDITITRDFIEDRVNTSHYGSAEAYLLLSLSIPLDSKQQYEVDHMYPQEMFKKKEEDFKKLLGDNKSLIEFYSEKENWDTVGNLQLLNKMENASKNKRKLSVWTKENSQQYKWSDYYIPKDENGEYIVQDDRFKDFVEKRKELLIDAIMASFDNI